MNFREELEFLIRARYPVLTIISNKPAWIPDVAVEIAGKRRKKSSKGAGEIRTSTSTLRQADTAQGATRRKNWAALVGGIVK